LPKIDVATARRGKCTTEEEEEEEEEVGEKEERTAASCAVMVLERVRSLVIVWGAAFWGRQVRKVEGLEGVIGTVLSQRLPCSPRRDISGL